MSNLFSTHSEIYIDEHQNFIKTKGIPAVHILTLSLVFHEQPTYEDLEQLSQLANKHHLLIEEIRKDSVKLQGKANDLSAAFGHTIFTYTVNDKKYHGLENKDAQPEEHLPEKLKDKIVAILGLSNHAVAKSYAQRIPLSEEKNEILFKSKPDELDLQSTIKSCLKLKKEKLSNSPKVKNQEQDKKVKVEEKDDEASVEPHYYSGYTGPQISKVYGFPTKYTGKGQSIAILELSGGITEENIKTYFQKIGAPLPKVVFVSVDGATNSPTTPNNSADGEVCLDVLLAGGVASGATIVVYFAVNTFQSFYNAFNAAMTDTTYKPKIISVSWGSSGMLDCYERKLLCLCVCKVICLALNVLASVFVYRTLLGWKSNECI